MVKRLKKHQAEHKTANTPTVTPAPTTITCAFKDQIDLRWHYVLVLSLATYILSLPMFEPGSVWLMGYCFLAPWLTAVLLARGPKLLYLTSYLLGAAYFLTHFRWMYITTPPGYVLGSLYLAATFPLGAWLIRRLVHRYRFPVFLVIPVIWVGLELLRSRGPLAFPWFLVGHSQIRLKTLIQMADLTGALGVTFVTVLINAWLVELIIASRPLWRAGQRVAVRVRLWPTVTAVCVLAAAIVYGRYRLAFDEVTEGPKISVLQGDYLLFASMESAHLPLQHEVPENDRLDRLIRDLLVDGDYEADKRLTYLELIEQAARAEPDMIVLPETPWAMYLNREMREMPGSALLKKYGAKDRTKQSDYMARGMMGLLQHEQLLELAETYDTYILTGSLTEIPAGPDVYPREYRYNSAFVYLPDASLEPPRYDKIHRVLFGEYVPFRQSKHFFWLYRFLNDGPWNPFGRDGNEYSLMPGTEFKIFKLEAGPQDQKEYAFGITICYEDVIPHVFRRFVVDDRGRKRADFMVNISNDGWFGRGVQQPQHLAASAFRAVENRVGIARSANTGVSGFIDSSGRYYDLAGNATAENPRAGGTGLQTARVVLDPRVTFYSRFGDVFGFVCALALAATIVDAWIKLAARLVRRRKSASA
jgi:apolipoprotein N-acyltransferase